MRTWPLSFAIAHRGASQRAPENTLAALKLAKARGATCVECDVQLTRDNKPIILHDATLQRTTNGKGFLSATPFDKVRALNAGSWFSKKFTNERVPTLQEWLTTCVKLKLALNLEMKARTKKRAKALAHIVGDELKKYWHKNGMHLAISSGNITCLTEIAKCYQTRYLGLIHTKRVSEKMLKRLSSKNITSLHQPYQLFDADYIARLHHHGFSALAYTVNDVRIAKQLKKRGIDGIFTDVI